MGYIFLKILVDKKYHFPVYFFLRTNRTEIDRLDIG